MCLATSCLWAGFAGSTCPCPWAGAFAVCLAGAGAFAVIAAGALPFAGAPPLGAAIAVPQRAPQRARAIVSFFRVLFMVVFLSSLRASSFSRLHKARRFARRLLTKLRGGCGERQRVRRGERFTARSAADTPPISRRYGRARRRMARLKSRQLKVTTLLQLFEYLKERKLHAPTSLPSNSGMEMSPS